MGEVHQLITEQGKLAALAGEHDRSVIEAAAAYLANEDSEIGFALFTAAGLKLLCLTNGCQMM
jgi:hypothetical protein